MTARNDRDTTRDTNNDGNSAKPSALVLAGLQAPQASLPPKLFYDLLGSTLFTSICLLPEYYQTRTEAQIFETHGADMATGLRPGFRLVDLGAGDCQKAASLIPLLQPAAYTPIDISADFLDASAASVAARFPALQVEPLVRDFTSAWSLPAAMQADPIVFFYPGSSIGNFDPDDAVSFLQSLRTVAGQACQLLIGIDTVKDPVVLEAAYDDAVGVTAAFNRNLLRNANRELGTNFDPAQWAHRALFNQSDSRIEMHLVAGAAVTVNWPGGERRFEAGETIHTENSYKYTRESFASLLDRAGFSLTRHWQDDNDLFMVILASATG